MDVLNRFFLSHYFKFFAPLIILFFVFMTNTPPIRFILINELNLDGWNTVVEKSKNLFSNLSYLDPSSHNAKTVFRLTIPVFVKLFKINFQTLILVQFIAYYIFIFFLQGLLIKYFNSLKISYILLLTICTTYFGKALIVDFRWFDGWAYLFIVLALYSRYNILVFVFILLGIFTDERVILSLPAIFILKNKTFDFYRMKFQRFKTFDSSIIIIIAFLSYVSIRIFLTLVYQMHMPLDLIGSPLIDNIQKRLVGPGFFTFFEGLWIVVILITYKIFDTRKMNIMFLLILLGFFGSCILVFSVYDVTRSGAYLMPYIFIFVLIAFNHFSKIEFKNYINCAFIVSVFFPGIFVISGVGMNNFILNDFLFVILNKIHF